MTARDHTVPIETLLGQREWVRGVARALVYGDSDAEDLEQQTWLAALEAPPRQESSPRGWLGTVLRRTASRLGRRDLERQARENASATRNDVPSPADIVAEVELRETVVRNVLALAEPYRTTILLRFYEDLPLREVARRTGAPLETVRSRLRRGLGLLRSEFEAKHAGAWPLGILPLAGAPGVKASGSAAAGAIMVMTKAKAILLVAVVAALSVAVWLASNDPRGSGASSHAPGLEPPAPPSGDAHAGRAPPPAAASPEAQPLRPARLVEAAVPAPPDGETVRVLVIDDATGKPIPGAEVAATDRATDSRDPRWRAGFAPLLADWDEAPQRIVADARGLATLQSCDRFIVAAKHGDSFGYRRFPEAPHGEIRLPVKAGSVIAARVVTAWGAPAPGIPVIVKVSHNLPQPGSRQAWVTSRKPDGLAIMSHDPVSPTETRDDTASAWIEGMEADAVKAPLSEVRKRPLTITMPLVGQLRVELLRPDGRPFTGTARVHVGVASGLPVEKRPDVIPSPSVRVDAVGGVATVSFAPVGPALSVVGEADEFELAIQDIAPLESASAVRSVVLEFPRERSLLVGRLVDEAGTPLVNRVVQVEMVIMRPPIMFSSPNPVTARARKFETDATGAFTIPAVERHSVRDGGVDLDFVIEDTPEVVGRSGSVNVPALSETGETRLGDIRLEPPDVLAAGVIVDDLGARLAGAVVTAQPARMDARPDVPVGTPMRGRSLNQTVIRTRSDASGAFTLALPPAARRSPAKIGLLNVKAELDGYTQRVRAGPVESGRRDLEVVLDGVGSIEGMLVLPRDLPVSKVRMTVTSTTKSAPQRFEDCVDSDGRFRLPGIRPGSVTLVITRAGEETPLATLRDIVVPRLGVSSDARLQAIELP